VSGPGGSPLNAARQAGLVRLIFGLTLLTLVLIAFIGDIRAGR
jgi:hypothetical protein